MDAMQIHHIVGLVLVSAIIQWLLGILWYGALFKKSWRTLTGTPENQPMKDRIFPMVTSFIACLLLSFVLVHVVAWAGARLFTSGAKMGVICWVGFIAPPLFAQHIFERRRANLFAINVAYWLIIMAVGGGILAAFR